MLGEIGEYFAVKNNVAFFEFGYELRVSQALFSYRRIDFYVPLGAGGALLFLAPLEATRKGMKQRLFCSAFF